jgi:hypothetical protein
MNASLVKRYLVTLATPLGDAEIEVPSALGPDAAGRRAWLTAVNQRWGDVDEITVTSVRENGDLSDEG